jgi:hypothetical protein
MIKWVGIEKIMNNDNMQNREVEAEKTDKFLETFDKYLLEMEALGKVKIIRGKED